jgi:uncharacterized protein
MPVTPSDIQRGTDFLVQQGATRVVLFGSAIETPETARDLDLACEGIPAEIFYATAGRISRLLGLPVDIVDLSDDPRFSRYILSRGRILFSLKSRDAALGRATPRAKR